MHFLNMTEELTKQASLRNNHEEKGSFLRNGKKPKATNILLMGGEGLKIWEVVPEKGLFSLLSKKTPGGI